MAIVTISRLSIVILLRLENGMRDDHLCLDLRVMMEDRYIYIFDLCFKVVGFFQ